MKPFIIPLLAFFLTGCSLTMNIPISQPVYLGPCVKKDKIIDSIQVSNLGQIYANDYTAVGQSGNYDVKTTMSGIGGAIADVVKTNPKNFVADAKLQIEVMEFGGIFSGGAFGGTHRESITFIGNAYQLIP